VMASLSMIASLPKARARQILAWRDRPGLPRPTTCSARGCRLQQGGFLAPIRLLEPVETMLEISDKNEEDATRQSV
jgi:hypothetical protein